MGSHFKLCVVQLPLRTKDHGLMQAMNGLQLQAVCGALSRVHKKKSRSYEGKEWFLIVGCVQSNFLQFFAPRVMVLFKKQMLSHFGLCAVQSNDRALAPHQLG